MSSKKAEIDWQMVGEYLNAQCSGVEIAEMIGIHENTLYNRCKDDLGLEFVAFSQQKKSEGRQSLKKRQYALAMSGDKTMLVWLGKQYLGQKDRTEVQNNISIEPTVTQVEIIHSNERSQIEGLQEPQLPS